MLYTVIVSPVMAETALCEALDVVPRMDKHIDLLRMRVCASLKKGLTGCSCSVVMRSMRC